MEPIQNCPEMLWNYHYQKDRECCAAPAMSEIGSFATDRCAPKIAPCPLFPESDAKSEPWHLSRRVTAVVAVTPCNVPL